MLFKLRGKVPSEKIQSKIFKFVADCFPITSSNTTSQKYGSQVCHIPRLTWNLDKNNRIFLKLQFQSTKSCEEYSTKPRISEFYEKEMKRNELLIFPSKEDSRDLISDILNNLHESVKTCSETSTQSEYTFQKTLNEGWKKEKLLVEFSSPNIAKPLHMGHLRSTVIGHFVDRIFRAVGHDVQSMCFLGDWGTQFGILQAGLTKWGNGMSPKQLSLGELLSFYVKAVKEVGESEEFSKEARQFSANLESLDPKAVKIWEEVREKTLEHLHTFWSQFGIKFDSITGESEFGMQSEYTRKSISLLESSPVFKKGDDGCLYAEITMPNNPTKLVKIPIVKSNGSSLYILRDIASAIWRRKVLDVGKLNYVVDHRQENHFISLFTILESLGVFPPNSLRYISFGAVEGMSSRSGNFVLVSDVVDIGTELMGQRRLASKTSRGDEKEIPKQLAVSALVVQALKEKRNKFIAFDWDEALKSNGNTGVNLQYAHARLKSLEEKQGFVDGMKIDVDYVLNDPQALQILLHAANFEEVFWICYRDLEPSILLAYLFKFVDQVGKGLKSLPIQSEVNRDIAESRLVLFAISRKILASSLKILGVQPLNEI